MFLVKKMDDPENAEAQAHRKPRRNPYGAVRRTQYGTHRLTNNQRSFLTEIFKNYQFKTQGELMEVVGKEIFYSICQACGIAQGRDKLKPTHDKGSNDQA